MAHDDSFAGKTDRKTRVLPIEASKIGRFIFENAQNSFLGDWRLELSKHSPDAANLKEAAKLLKNTDVPVAFPTETVYGLGADATRSSAVRGIYNAKQRPSDNPLIVHVSSLSQLRNLLDPQYHSAASSKPSQDPIHPIYHPLISRFWPGPLTILLPLPTPSPFASEVTTSLPTVGIRMPSSELALAIIRLAGVPLAAPSANASTKPSPTTAAHVLHDLSGRIDLVLDGGPCNVGVESTVVDGLSNPPVILRPGGISIEMLRQCTGWEDVRIGYKDGAESGMPRAPGMKYKHYSPKARVLLVQGQLDLPLLQQYVEKGHTFGVLRTKRWEEVSLETSATITGSVQRHGTKLEATYGAYSEPIITESAHLAPTLVPSARCSRVQLGDESTEMTDVWDVVLGPETAAIARGLFSALRELDQKGVDVIFVEGIDGNEGDIAAAVMNRLRKAAEIEIKT